MVPVTQRVSPQDIFAMTFVMRNSVAFLFWPIGDLEFLMSVGFACYEMLRLGLGPFAERSSSVAGYVAGYEV